VEALLEASEALAAALEVLGLAARFLFFDAAPRVFFGLTLGLFLGAASRLLFGLAAALRFVAAAFGGALFALLTLGVGAEAPVLRLAPAEVGLARLAA